MRIALVAAILALIVPFGAQASHCASDVAILSRAAPTGPAVDVNAFACAVAPANEQADTRIINPGSTQVSVRYTAPQGPDHFDAELSGLGLSDRTVTLTWANTVPGFGAYQSEWVWIDITRAGTLTASIAAPGNPAVTYHTLGA